MAFDLSLQLHAPLPVSDVRCHTHKLEAQGLGTDRVQLALADDAARDNRDFILEYSLAGERTATGLMLYRAPDEPGAENFFLALVEPPKSVAAVQINPRDYIFVVDISGSMHGHPLNTAKVLLRDLIGGLRPSDTFNVVLFSGSSRVLSEQSVPATQANIDRALRTIDQMGGGGSTEIVPALRRVAALPKPADVSRSVIVVTDGYVTVENEVFQLVRRNLDHAQRVRVRHRQRGEPPPDRRPGARRPGRGLHRHQARARSRTGRTAAPHDRCAGADAVEGALRRPGRVRRRADLRCPT